MAAPTLFAQMPPTPEGIVAQLQRQLHAEFPRVSPSTSIAVDAIVAQSVREMWVSRVTTFVPVLAHREAVAWLHARGIDPRPFVAADDGTRRDDGAAGPSSKMAAPRDALRIDGDVLRVDGRDVVPL
jgi:hypothetical protein